MSESASGSNVAAIAELEDRRFEAMLSNDVDALDEMFDDELVYTHSSGTVDTKSSYLDAMRSGRFVYRSVQRSDEEVHDHGEAVVVIGHVRMDVLIGKEQRDVDSRFTLTWVRKDGQWRFVAWQSTPARA